MTKIFAINGSPNMEKGDTDMLLRAFLVGMEEAGAEVALYYASQLNLKPCSCGQMYCWYRKPGKCCLKDTMDDLYPQLWDADILVLGTPVYIPLPGQMQDFINRLCPLIEPVLTYDGSRTRAKFHDAVKIRKIVLVATGGWWELENFDTVVRIVRDFSETAGVDFPGPILRPHSFLMSTADGLTDEGKSVLEETRKAGCQLVAEGCIAPEKLALISRPLIPEGELRDRYNKTVARLKGTAG